MDLTLLEVGRLHVDPMNPRPAAGDVDDLADSIRTHGIVNPLIVRPHDGGYGVLSGQRRLAAAVQVDLEVVPCIVRTPADDVEALELSTAENVGRRAMDPMTEARTFRKLLEETGWTQQQLAGRLGTSEFTVSTRLQLLGLPEDLQAEVESGELAPSRAYAQIKKARGKKRAGTPRGRKADPLVSGELELRVQRRSAQLGEPPRDLVGRAVRRELQWPSCVKCEAEPASTGIGRGALGEQCRRNGGVRRG